MSIGLRPHVLTLCASLLVLLIPTAWSVYDSAWLRDWRRSERFDGQAYILTTEGIIRAESDSTGVAASIANIATWNGNPVSEGDVLRRFQDNAAATSLAEFATLAAGFDLHGQWLRAEAAALPRLNVPFIAHVNEGGGRVVIVRGVRGGYVYATDPSRGEVLYPHERFKKAWTGQVFAFPDPPAQPEEWY